MRRLRHTKAVGLLRRLFSQTIPLVPDIYKFDAFTAPWDFISHLANDDVFGSAFQDRWEGRLSER